MRPLVVPDARLGEIPEGGKPRGTAPPPSFVVFLPVKNISSQLHALADHFATRRPAILDDWREACLANAKLPATGTVPRVHLEDHIPAVLDEWAVILRALPENGAAPSSRKQESDHSLQRWPQGCRLKTLLHEWGLLHLVMAHEISAFAAIEPGGASTVQTVAHRELIKLIHQGIEASVAHCAEADK